MPDPFFASQKPHKRKRTDSTSGAASSKSKLARTSSFGRSKSAGSSNRTERPSKGSRNQPQTNGKGKGKGRQVDNDSDLSPSGEDDDGEDINDMDLRASDVDPNESGSEDDQETPAEKRLRLAQMHLDGLKGEMLADGEFDAAEIDRELVSSRLRQEVAAHSGKLHIFIADQIHIPPIPSKPLRTKGHRLPLTCAAASEDCTALYTTSKDGSVIRYALRTGAQVAIARKVRLSSSSISGGGSGAGNSGKKKKKGKPRAGLGEDVEGHTDEIWTLAVSFDGRYVATGGKDRRIGVWDTSASARPSAAAGAGATSATNESQSGLKWVRGFGGHRDGITSLSFRRSTHQLYTASQDRTLKLFDLSPSIMGYVETLFGHQDSVQSVTSLAAETAVSCGARDRTVRFWKVVDEAQLVFRGGGRSKVREVLEGVGADDDDGANGNNDDAEHGGGAKSKNAKGKGKEMRFEEGSIECVAMVDESTFVSGGDTGTISVWSTQKKKPIFTQPLAHGMHEVESSTEGIVATPRWITAIASLPYSDLLASGSWEGEIRLWKIDLKAKSLFFTGSLPAVGYVNSLQLLSIPKHALANATWTSPSPPAQAPAPEANGLTNGKSKHGDGGGEPAVLVVAGVSQEPRLARWMRIKEEGVVNGALVWALRTASMSSS